MNLPTRLFSSSHDEENISSARPHPLRDEGPRSLPVARQCTDRISFSSNSGKVESYRNKSQGFQVGYSDSFERRPLSGERLRYFDPLVLELDGRSHAVLREAEFDAKALKSSQRVLFPGTNSLGLDVVAVDSSLPVAGEGVAERTAGSPSLEGPLKSVRPEP